MKEGGFHNYRCRSLSRHLVPTLNGQRPTVDAQQSFTPRTVSNKASTFSVGVLAWMLWMVLNT